MMLLWLRYICNVSLDIVYLKAGHVQKKKKKSHFYPGSGIIQLVVYIYIWTQVISDVFLKQLQRSRFTSITDVLKVGTAAPVTAATQVSLCVAWSQRSQGFFFEGGVLTAPLPPATLCHPPCIATFPNIESQ